MQVFIVGAGASAEFGLPVGATLKEQIIKLCEFRFDEWGKLRSGDRNFLRYCEGLVQRDGLPRVQARLILTSIFQKLNLAPSIDNFLNMNRANETLVKVGKAAIIWVLKDAETRSTLRNAENPTGPKLEASNGTWLHKYFMSLATRGSLEEVLACLGNTKFVCFNYDRCIEQYLYFALKAYFDLDQTHETELLSAINVIHTYGTIEVFQPDGSGGSNFGKESYGNLRIAPENIRTFSEGSEENTQKEIRLLFTPNTQVVFLGFGFLELNLELLFGSDRYDVLEVVGTTKGMSQDDEEITTKYLKTTLFKSYGSTDFALFQDVHLANLTCAQLFDYFGKRLAG